MAEYQLSARLTATDSGFTSTISRALRETEKLESTIGKVKKTQDLKIKLGVDGMARLERLQTAIQNARNANKPLSVKIRDAATNQINKLKSDLQRLTGKAYNIAVNIKTNGAEKLSGLKSSLSEGIGGAAMGMGATMLGTAGIGYGAVNAVQSQMNFEKEMSSVKAILSSSYSGEQLERVMTSITEKAEEMGATTKFTAAESAKALYYMGMAGWKDTQMLAGLPAILNLAAAGNTDLATTSDIVTDSLTAFGLKAGETVKVNGRAVESSKHYTDMMAALVTNANTDISGLGEMLKYAAPLVQSMNANGDAAAKMYGAQDLMLVGGLMANAGIKGSQAGTSARAMFTRLSSQNRNAYFGQNALGVDFLDGSGEVRRLRDVVSDFRKVFKEGADMGRVTDFFEQISGEKIHADTRRKLESFFETAQANGGKLSGSEMMKMTAMMSGQEAMSGWLAAFLASDEDFAKIQNALENCEGAAERMAAIQLDNLAGDITLLGSAWDAFQRNLVKGDASAGLREFTQGLTDTLSKANELFKDGIQLGDFAKIGADVITKLKNKFLELDGIGSILAGGALFLGLKKILQLGLKVKDTLSGLTKIKTAGDIGQALRGNASTASSVGTMNVKAGVVNLSGNVRGGNGAVNRSQARVDEYYRRRGEILSGRTQGGSTGATGALTRGLKTFGGGAAMAGVFSLFDVLGTRTNSEYTNNQAVSALNEERAQLKYLRENGAEVEQIRAQVAKIRAAEENAREVAAQNRQAERETNAGAVGAMLGAGLGSLIPVVGPLIGGMLGGVLGEFGGSWLAKNFGENQPPLERRVDAAGKSFAGTGAELAESSGFNSAIQQLNQKRDEYDRAFFGENKNWVDSLRKTKPRQEISAAERRAQTRQAHIDDNKRALQNFGYSSLGQNYLQPELPKIITNAEPKKAPEPFKLPETAGQNFSANFQPSTAQNFQPLPIPQDFSANFTAQVDSIKEAANSAWESFTTSAASAVESVQTNISSFGESFSSTFESVRANISTFGEDIYSSFSTTFETLQSGFMSFGESFSAAFESVRASFSSFGEEIYSSFSTIFESVNASVSSTFAAIGGTISAGVESARAIISSGFQSAAAEVQAIWGAIPGFFGGIFGGLGGIASAAGSAIAAGINSGIGAIMGAWESLSGWLSSKIASLSSMAAGAAAAIGIGSNATGTASWRGGLTEVNEHGGEIIILPNGQTIYPRDTTQSILNEKTIAHNATGTAFFEGGWSEVNEHGGEIMYLPRGTQIIPHATTVKILRHQIKERLNELSNTNKIAENVRTGLPFTETGLQTSNATADLSRRFGNAGTLKNRSAGNNQPIRGLEDNHEVNQNVQRVSDNIRGGDVDELGNLRNVQIPEYNRITADDSLAVKKAKQAAQMKLAHNATGTAYFGGGFSEVNERGGELISLPDGKNILPQFTFQNVLTDELGNLRGVAIPEYNRITADDSLTVKKAKQAAQMKLAHNATGTAYFGGGFSEVNERGGEIISLPDGKNILPQFTFQNVLTDELGNLRGVAIPEYNRITADDSLAVKKAKQAAQLRSVGNGTSRSIRKRVETGRKSETGNADGLLYKPVSKSTNPLDYLPKQSTGGADRIFDGIGAVLQTKSTNPLDYLPKQSTGGADRVFDGIGTVLQTLPGIGELPNLTSAGLPPLDLSPKFPADSQTSNNTNTNTNNNSSVNFNFGGVNISNGLDFDNFTHQLTRLFTASAANSIQV